MTTPTGQTPEQAQRQMWLVYFRTLPVHTDYSADASRKEGRHAAYVEGATRQEAEDNARTWLSYFTDAARVVSSPNAARRILGPVIAGDGPTAPQGRAPRGAFTIYANDRGDEYFAAAEGSGNA